MVFHLATGDRKACFVKGLLFFTDTVQFMRAVLVAVSRHCMNALFELIVTFMSLCLCTDAVAVLCLFILNLFKVLVTLYFTG